jgi:hypothetical protein
VEPGGPVVPPPKTRGSVGGVASKVTVPQPVPRATVVSKPQPQPKISPRPTIDADGSPKRQPHMSLQEFLKVPQCGLLVWLPLSTVCAIVLQKQRESQRRPSTTEPDTVPFEGKPPAPISQREGDGTRLFHRVSTTEESQISSARESSEVASIKRSAPRETKHGLSRVQSAKPRIDVGSTDISLTVSKASIHPAQIPPRTKAPAEPKVSVEDEGAVARRVAREKAQAEMREKIRQSRLKAKEDGGKNDEIVVLVPEHKPRHLTTDVSPVNRPADTGIMTPILSVSPQNAQPAVIGHGRRAGQRKSTEPLGESPSEAELKRCVMQCNTSLVFI